ncbi:hypothetical protein BaRGS_00029637, partial [Batillaria attramentaria]
MGWTLGAQEDIRPKNVAPEGEDKETGRTVAVWSRECRILLKEVRRYAGSKTENRLYLDTNDRSKVMKVKGVKALGQPGPRRPRDSIPPNLADSRGCESDGERDIYTSLLGDLVVTSGADNSWRLVTKSRRQQGR